MTKREGASSIVSVVDALEGKVAAEFLPIDIVSGYLAFELFESDCGFLVGLLLSFDVEKVIVIWETFEKWCAETIENSLLTA